MIDKLKISIVDDDTNIGKVLSKFLTKKSYEIVGIYTDTQDAIKGILENGSDIILMDISINTPNDGIQTAKTILEHKNIPIIYLTGSGSNDIMSNVIESAPFGYLQKPIDFSQLLITIQMAISKFKIIEKLKHSEKMNRVSAKTLQILNNKKDDESFTTILDKIITTIKTNLSIDAVGITISMKNSLPCFVSLGFPNKKRIIGTLLNYSNSSIGFCKGCPDYRDGLCGTVIDNEFNEDITEFTTIYGSFWNNDIENNLNFPKFEDIYKVCGYSGYQSMAIVPIKFENQNIGMIQINNIEKESISLELVEFIESISQSIEITLNRESLVQKLQERDDIFRESQEVAKIIGWEYNIANKVFSFTGSGINVVPKDSLGNYTIKSLLAVVHKNDIHKITSLFSNMRSKNRNVTYEESFKIQLNSKSDVTYVRTSFHIIKKNEQVIVRGIFQDITDRELTLIQVEENELFLDTILSRLKAAIVIIDSSKNKVVHINQEMTSLMGDESKSLIGIKGTRFLSTHYFKSIPVENNSSNNNDVEEALLKINNGTFRPVRKVIITTPWHGSKHFIVVLFDITREKTMERRLQHKQKMESMGLLSEGIAQEIHTPVQFIGDNLQFISDSYNDLHELIENLEDILKGNNLGNRVNDIKDEIDYQFITEELPLAINQSQVGLNRIAKIIYAMQNFSHSNQENMVWADINDLIETSLTVAQNEWKYVAEMETDFDTSLPNVKCRADEIQQVFLNLIVNSAYAIKNAMKDSNDLGKITIRSAKKDNSVVISIKDSGGGIPKAYYNRVFDPFFTTKSSKDGTGQGLAIAYSVVVKKHNGMIRFDTKEGVGTTFFITLPIDAADKGDINE